MSNISLGSSDNSITINNTEASYTLANNQNVISVLPKNTSNLSLKTQANTIALGNSITAINVTRSGVGEKGERGEAGTGGAQSYETRIDMSNPLYVYVGKSDDADQPSAPIWQIRRYEKSTKTTEYADNSTDFIKTWNDRAGYNY